MLAELVVGWEDYVANIQTMLRDMSFMSLRSDIMLWLLYILKLQHMHFPFDYFCSVATYDIIFWCRPVYYKTFILWNSLIYTILKA